MLKNKIVWSEGMFLQPQHFQQQDRYFEFLVHQSISALSGNNWGISSLKIDKEQLMIGKVTLTRCQGIFPDGTIFDIPSTDNVPLSLSPDQKDTIIYLALPLRKPGAADISLLPQSDMNNHRYYSEEYEIFDSSSKELNSTQLNLAKLALSLKFGSERLDDYLCIGLARIKEIRNNHSITLDDSYIPPILNIKASSRALAIIKEIYGLLHQKGESLSQYTRHISYKKSSDIEEFLLLQLVNRYESIFRLFLKREHTKPESVYCALVQLISELATFTTKDRRTPKIVDYLHDNIQASLEPLIKLLYSMIGIAAKPRSLSLPLKKQEHGIWVSSVEDLSLFSSADFILAVNAGIPREILRTEFPLQAKSAPLEHIWDLIKHALPGIPFNTLTEVPHGVPYNEEYEYFLLDNQHALWAYLEKSNAIAFYVGNQFPDLTMELWAIKNDN